MLGSSELAKISCNKDAIPTSNKITIAVMSIREEKHLQCCSMLGVLSHKFSIDPQVFLLIDAFPLHLAFIVRFYKNPFDLEFLEWIELTCLELPRQVLDIWVKIFGISRL